MMEIISHAPCCKVVKKLFNSMDPLYFHTSIAHLRHGWACINQHLIKAKFRNHWNTFFSHPKLKLIHLLAWIHACIEDWIKLWSICFCSAGFDDAYFIATFYLFYGFVWFVWHYFVIVIICQMCLTGIPLQKGQTAEQRELTRTLQLNCSLSCWQGLSLISVQMNFLI